LMAEEVVRPAVVDAKTARDALELAIPKILPAIKRKVPKKIWKAPALLGQPLYETKMMDPAVLARRKDKIEKLTDDDWRNPYIEKGGPIIGPRVKAALPKYETKVDPYLKAIAAVELPPRVVDPMENIENRVKPIVAALVAKKEELGGS